MDIPPSFTFHPFVVFDGFLSLLHKDKTLDEVVPFFSEDEFESVKFYMEFSINDHGIVYIVIEWYWHFSKVGAQELNPRCISYDLRSAITFLSTLLSYYAQIHQHPPSTKLLSYPYA